MLRYLLLALILIYGSYCVRAQPGFKKTFVLEDQNISVTKSFDITQIGHNFYSYGLGHTLDSNVHTAYVLKSDEYGNILEHRYLFDGHKTLSFWSYVVNMPEMAVLDNGNFVFVIEDFATPNHEVFCVDTNLNIVWHTTIIGTPNVSSEIPTQLVSDGNDIYIGCNISPKVNSGNPYLSKYIKLNKNGHILWTKINETISFLWGLEFDLLKKNLYLSGLNKKEEDTYYNYVQKVDTSLNLIFEHFKLREGYLDYGYSILEINNSTDFISPSYDVKETPWYSTEAIGTGFALNITRRDIALNTVWKIPLYPSTSHNNGFATIIPSRDGNYFSLAQVVSFMYDVGGMSTGFSDSVPIMNSLITKFTADGQVIWQRMDTMEYFASTNHTWTEVGGIYAMEDGGIMVNGVCIRRFADKPEQMRGWIMRIGADGCLMEGDCGISSAYAMEPTLHDVILYPNPTTGMIRFGRSTLHTEIVSCRVYNSAGVLVLKIPPRTLQAAGEFDLGGLSQGIYFIELTGANRFNIIKKIVVIK